MTKATESTAVSITPEQLSMQVAVQSSLLNRLGSVGGGNKIKVEAGVFTFPDGQRFEDEMDAVIVDFAFVNSFYPGRFDAKNPTPPVCGATGIKENGMIPSEKSSKKQSDSCNSCPNNQYGSAGNGKACKNEVWLAIIAANATEESEMYILKLSPTAITPFKKYANAVGNSIGEIYDAVTHFTFDQTTSYPKVLCSNPSRQRNSNPELAMKRRNEAAQMLANGINFGI